VNQAARLSGGNSKTLSLRGYVSARMGRVEDARAVVDTLQTIAVARYVPPYAFALVHAGLGEAELALDWLRRAEQEHDVHMAFLTVDAKWDFLRSDPRFLALLNDCGFLVAQHA
jgi:hypothetical protein